MFIKSIWLGPTIIMMLYLLSSLHRAAIQAIAAYLDAFQKIADAATNSRGKFKPRTRLGCSPISRYWKYRGFPSIPPPRYCIIAFRCSLFMGLRAVGGGHRSDFYTHSCFRCLRCWFSLLCVRLAMLLFCLSSRISLVLLFIFIYRVPDYATSDVRFSQPTSVRTGNAKITRWESCDRYQSPLWGSRSSLKMWLLHWHYSIIMNLLMFQILTQFQRGLNADIRTETRE